jgi:transcriptional regulator with XRE-family HTH domain
MNLAMETGKRILELRHRKGMTQEQLGQQLHVSGQAVSKWENGDSLPDTTLLGSLAETLECSIDYLLGANKNGSLRRLLPTLEAELQEMKPDEKIDMAFKLFHLIDKSSIKRTSSFKEEAMARLPFIHAGPDGITVHWQGKFLCSVSIEALNETEAVWSMDDLPFELFPDNRKALFAVLLQHKKLFNSDAPIPEASLLADWPAGVDFEESMRECLESGILEKGKGGYRLGIRAEIVIRLLGVLLRSVGKPGTISQRSSNPPA